MEEIELIKDIIASPNADTIGNKLMDAKVELNVTRSFLNDPSNCTDDYDISLYYKMILGKHIEYLQYKIELLERMHSKLQNNKYELLEELTTVPRKPKKNKQDTKKEVSCSIPYTSSDNVDMLI